MHDRPLVPQFVILFHKVPAEQLRHDHWDLMLEDQGALITWALESEPKIGATISADRLPDHRVVYLNYQGQLSDNRGTVQRTAKGTLDWICRTEKLFVVELHQTGRRRWQVSISKTERRSASGQTVWECHFEESPSGGDA